MAETTTNDPVADPGADPVQPADPQEPAAVTDPNSEPATPPNPDGQPDEPPAPATNSDDDLTDYWTKKGIDITTPEGQAQAAKSYREAEKAMHAKGQQASELTKQINAQPLNVDTDNELVKQALEKSNQLETTLAVRDLKANNNITPEQDKALGAYVTANPDKAYMLRNGFLSLDDVYKMSGVGTLDQEALKKQGGQEALQTLANKQRVSAPQGGASQRAAPVKEDPILAILTSD